MIGSMTLLSGLALAQVVPTGSFTGEISEGFETYAFTTAALPCVSGTLDGLGDVCAPDANVGGIQIKDQLFLGGCLATPYAGTKMAGSNDGAIGIEFDSPVLRFGGRFTTHASTPGNVIIEAFDHQGVEIGSLNEPLSGCTWAWHGLEVVGGLPIHSVIIRHTLNQGALIDIDALQVETACGVNATDSDGDGAPSCMDCDDAAAAVFPGAVEDCNGVDDDCNGTVDDDPVEAPLAGLQDGVCVHTLQVCSGGAWSEPDYTDLPGYEALEATCDGLDNDCNGAVDDALVPPPVGPEDGVCLALLATCDGDLGWSSPDEADWPSLVAYEATEVTCDGLDNDCDGAVDDGLEAPLADNQQGVCEGAVQVCDGEGGWVEPDYSTVPDYADTEICDELDNDCNGTVDEECIESVSSKGCSSLASPPSLAPWRRR